MMQLQEINQSPTPVVAAALSKCCGAQRWVNGMLALRPFADKASLFEAAERVWHEACGEQDWREAFTHHPKIGDVDQLKKRFAATHQWSGEEQAGVDAADESIIQALAEGNRNYEERFGYIFIVCATGKSAGEMLQLLLSRLPNPPEKEILIAMGEQHKITLLRLGKLLITVHRPPKK